MSNVTRLSAASRALGYRIGVLDQTKQLGIRRDFTPKQRRRILQKSKHTVLPVGRELLDVVQVDEVEPLLHTNPWDEGLAELSYEEQASAVVDLIRESQPAETSGDFGPVTVPARPCGGTDHCITGSGKKASKTHVKCAA
ncbi:hypothetical protein AB0C87_24805 [Actinomadura sp. NPDC048021]|uniref:hypothetical protein n=1 Tax=Actinomadura sp. NPDC048021 TaxID=3155385 RepID=UPI003408EB07